MFEKESNSLIDDSGECISAIANVQQKIDALSADYHASYLAGHILDFICCNLRVFGLFILLDLSQNIWIQVVSQELLLFFLCTKFI